MELLITLIFIVLFGSITYINLKGDKNEKNR